RPRAAGRQGARPGLRSGYPGRPGPQPAALPALDGVDGRAGTEADGRPPGEARGATALPDRDRDDRRDLPHGQRRPGHPSDDPGDEDLGAPAHGFSRSIARPVTFAFREKPAVTIFPSGWMTTSAAPSVDPKRSKIAPFGPSVGSSSPACVKRATIR